MTQRIVASVLVAAWALASCACAPEGPAHLDTRADTCAVCRMLVSDRKRASQIVVPSEEPRFFDDVSCLASYLKSTPSLSPEARVYVANRNTGEWTEVQRAEYLRLEAAAGSMGAP
jgi:nitrous oxide reductase accessory protein NosL